MRTGRMAVRCRRAAPRGGGGGAGQTRGKVVARLMQLLVFGARAPAVLHPRIHGDLVLSKALPLHWGSRPSRCESDVCVSYQLPLSGTVPRLKKKTAPPPREALGTALVAERRGAVLLNIPGGLPEQQWGHLSVATFFEKCSCIEHRMRYLENGRGARKDVLLVFERKVGRAVRACYAYARGEAPGGAVGGGASEEEQLAALRSSGERLRAAGDFRECTFAVNAVYKKWLYKQSFSPEAMAHLFVLAYNIDEAATMVGEALAAPTVGLRSAGGWPLADVATWLGILQYAVHHLNLVFDVANLKATGGTITDGPYSSDEEHRKDLLFERMIFRRPSLHPRSMYPVVDRFLYFFEEAARQGRVLSMKDMLKKYAEVGGGHDDGRSEDDAGGGGRGGGNAAGVSAAGGYAASPFSVDSSGGNCGCSTLASNLFLSAAGAKSAAFAKGAAGKLPLTPQESAGARFARRLVARMQNSGTPVIDGAARARKLLKKAAKERKISLPARTAADG